MNRFIPDTLAGAAENPPTQEFIDPQRNPRWPACKKFRSICIIEQSNAFKIRSFCIFWASSSSRSKKRFHSKDLSSKSRLNQGIRSKPFCLFSDRRKFNRGALQASGEPNARLVSPHSLLRSCSIGMSAREGVHPISDPLEISRKETDPSTDAWVSNNNKYQK